MLIPVSRLEVLAVGEILWDVVNGHRHLGGAPFNFTYHARALGAQARLLSRVGRDEAGESACARAAELGISNILIQTDTAHPTGIVDVQVKQGGDAEFSIPAETAWDYIEFPDTARNALDQADILYFGTLAQRSPLSRATVSAVLASAHGSTLKVLDLNLRKPTAEPRVIRQSLAQTDILKINEEELEVLRGMFELPADQERAAQALMERFAIGTVAITRGSKGAVAYNAYGERAEAPAIGVVVLDTIGAGDAFMAAFVTELAVRKSLEDALLFANGAGAYVAGQAGATPPISRAIVKQFAQAAGAMIERPKPKVVRTHH